MDGPLRTYKQKAKKIPKLNFHEFFCISFGKGFN